MRHPVGGAPPPGKRRWRVTYDSQLRCWMAYTYPSDRGDRLSVGWAFAKWEDAYRYANSNGRIRS